MAVGQVTRESGRVTVLKEKRQFYGAWSYCTRSVETAEKVWTFPVNPIVSEAEIGQFMDRFPRGKVLFTSCDKISVLNQVASIKPDTSCGETTEYKIDKVQTVTPGETDTELRPLL